MLTPPGVKYYLLIDEWIQYMNGYLITKRLWQINMTVQKKKEEQKKVRIENNKYEKSLKMY